MLVILPTHTSISHVPCDMWCQLAPSEHPRASTACPGLLRPAQPDSMLVRPNESILELKPGCFQLCICRWRGLDWLWQQRSWPWLCQGEWGSVAQMDCVYWDRSVLVQWDCIPAAWTWVLGAACAAARTLSGHPSPVCRPHLADGPWTLWCCRSRSWQVEVCQAWQFHCWSGNQV